MPIGKNDASVLVTHFPANAQDSRSLPSPYHHRCTWMLKRLQANWCTDSYQMRKHALLLLYHQKAVQVEPVCKLLCSDACLNTAETKKNSSINIWLLKLLCSLAQTSFHLTYLKAFFFNFSYKLCLFFSHKGKIHHKTDFILLASLIPVYFLEHTVTHSLCLSLY